MQHPTIVVLLLVGACSKGAPHNAAESAASAAVSAAVVGVAPVASPAVDAAPQSTWYVGLWKGDFAAKRHVSTTTTKQGGPAAWEKDDGQKLSGPGTVEISVDANGEVTGTVKGALGELDLRGKVDGEDLRAKLVAKSDDPTAIHNGYLVLAREADTLKGRLGAASGDALAMRQAEVALKKVSP